MPAVTRGHTAYLDVHLPLEREKSRSQWPDEKEFVHLHKIRIDLCRVRIGFDFARFEHLMNEIN